MLGGIAYVAAAQSLPRAPGAPWLDVHISTLFAFACASAALLWARESLRSKLASAYLLVAAFATLSYVDNIAVMQIALPLVGTVAAYAITRELETDRKWQATGNMVIPLLFLAAVIISSSGPTPAALAAVALTLIAGLMTWDSDEEERPQHLFVTAFASGIAIVSYLFLYDTRCIGALALHAALFSIALRSTRSKVLVVPILISLVAASLWTFVLLMERPDYHYTPFGGIPSLCALTVVAAWIVFSNALSAHVRSEDAADEVGAQLVGMLAISAAFLWARQELVAAYSPDIAARRSMQ